MKPGDLNHTTTIQILCDMRGYAPEEVEQWIDETYDDYDADLASEYATISSRLSDFAEQVLK